MNNETVEQTDNTPAPAKIYPEQENPPRPTYAAIIRGVHISGFLYYLPDGLLIKIRIDSGTGDTREENEIQFSIDDPNARAKAKREWQKTVVQVLQAV